MTWALRLCLLAIVSVWLAGPLRAESKGVESAQLVTYLAPVLPADSQAKPPSSVDLLATLGADGKLHDLMPVGAEDEFTTAAREAAAQWVYTPYKRKGQPFAMKVYVRVALGAHEHQVAYPTPLRMSTAFMARLIEKQTNPVMSPIPGSGAAVLLGTIARDGSVEDAKLMSGPPVFAAPAQDSVRHWTYRPLLLDGVPVAVETTMRVDFTR